MAGTRKGLGEHKVGRCMSGTGGVVAMAVGAHARIAARIICGVVVVQRLVGADRFGRTGGGIRNGRENKGSEDESHRDE